MRFHGVGSRLEENCLFFRALALPQELRDRAFASRERGQARWLAAGDRMALVQESGEHKIIHAGREKHTFALQGFDGRDQIPGGIRLQDKTARARVQRFADEDRKSTRLNSSHSQISYTVFCLKKNTAHSAADPSNTPRSHSPAPANRADVLALSHLVSPPMAHAVILARRLSACVIL